MMMKENCGEIRNKFKKSILFYWWTVQSNHSRIPSLLDEK
jgi:hypothetical protein